MKLTLHPFLFAAFPILALLSYNIGEIRFRQGIPVLLVSLLCALVLLLLLRLITGSWSKAGLITSVALLLFFSYGQVYLVIEQNLAEFSLGRHRILLPFFGLLFATWVWLVLRKVKHPAEVGKVFNILGFVLLILPAVTIGTDFFRQIKFELGSTAAGNGAKNTSRETLPDIYYIILDGYGRQDVLEELYQLDNTKFLQFLEQRSFYVAGESRSNYNQTALSLASSLNQEYVNFLAEELGVDTKKRDLLAQMIKHSQLRILLQAEGYQMIAFQSGYERTEIRSADDYWSLDKEVDPYTRTLLTYNAFESLVLESTVIRAALDLQLIRRDSLYDALIDPGYQAHRDRILYAFRRLSEVPDLDGNFFVFAHILSPHPPFVFDSQGDAVIHDRPYEIADGDSFHGSKDEYLERYPEQVQFINKKLMNVIQAILAKSDPSPIIILQGDHGPGAYLVWDSVSESNLKERFGILNAYHFPGGDGGMLYPSITPVNTFRVVLNRYFGKNYEFLPDESYFSPWDRPYDFTKVTDFLEE
jgi:hypothetical protein